MPGVLFVWENVYAVGGVESLLVQFLRNLPNYGLQPYILETGTASGPQREQLSAFSDYIIHAPQLSRDLENAWSVGLIKRIEASKIALVVLNEWVCGQIAVDLPPEIPILAICHVDLNGSNYYATAAALEGRLSAIVGVSETICSKLKTTLPIWRRSAVQQISYGVEAVPLKPSPPTPRPIRLIYLGRIQQEQKRIFDLVAFVEKLNDLNVDCILTLVGEGIDCDQLVRLLSACSGTVEFRYLGPLRHDIAMEQLSRQDIYLLFSDYEGLPISLLEALIRGVVPVVSRVQSGVTEVLVDSVSAKMFPVGRPDLAAEIVSALAQDQPRLQLLRHASRQLGEKFTLDRMLTNYSELFHRAIRKAHRRLRISRVLRKLGAKQRCYEVYGRRSDGWMAPHGLVRIVYPMPTDLRLDIEIPGWLPFKYPVTVSATIDEHEIATLAASAPGYYTLAIPPSQQGIIKLSADQWFVPAEFGAAADERRLSYRLLRLQS
jgi:glycosyltransferase involved in cell wall biosynthesis